jgi:hypothetical protein
MDWAEEDWEVEMGCEGVEERTLWGWEEEGEGEDEG